MVDRSREDTLSKILLGKLAGAVHAIDKLHDGDYSQYNRVDDLIEDLLAKSTVSASHGAVCPKCGHARDGRLDSLQVSNRKESKPKANDCTVCAKCAAVLIFQADMTLVEMTEDEKKELSSEDREQMEAVQEYTRKYSPFS